MTGDSSIQISYLTEDGITTEELVTEEFGAPEFLAEVEDAEEYPISSEPVESKESVREATKFLNRAIEFELKMVTLITDKNSDGVRIVRPDEQEADVVQAQVLSQASPTKPIIDPEVAPELDYVVKLLLDPTPEKDPATETNVAEVSVLNVTPTQTEPTLSCNADAFSEESTDAVAQEPSEADEEKAAEELTMQENFTLEEPSSIEANASGSCYSSPRELERGQTEDSEFSFSIAQYDGPPILSPNYHSDGQTELRDADVGEEAPPALTEECSASKDVWTSQHPCLKRKRGPKPKKKPKLEALSDSRNGTADPGKSDSKALHKEAQNKVVPHVVIPHSSAEIQERVKNRHRKATQTYRSGSSFDSGSDVSGDQPKNSQKQKKRKGSSESSASEQKKPKKSGLFIVEKILKKGIINGRPYFYVKWLNYPESKNTWEPEENFSLDLIAAYKKTVEEMGQLLVIKDVKEKKPRGPRSRRGPRPGPKSKTGPQQSQLGPRRSSVVSSVARRNSRTKKEECPGCLSYPITFTDNRVGLNGFDQDLTYHKIFESFVLDEERCALVEFDEKHCLELIPLAIINERLKAELKLN